MSAELYVVLSNLSSKQNLGTFLRTASAFGATQVVVGASLWCLFSGSLHRLTLCL